MWGSYHAHRHHMRYDIVAGWAREHLPSGGTVVDIGCGGAMVADRLRDLKLTYIGLDFGGHHIAEAARRHGTGTGGLRTRWVRGSATEMPMRDGIADVVVWTEVIEHLVRPELAVWEVARILKPGGVLVMTTNNASEMPLHSPLSHLFPWLEKAIGFRHDRLVSFRPWVWPWPVDADLLPAEAPPVYLPHTWHLQAETRRMLAAAGLETFHASTFEFPPPQSRTASWLQGRGTVGEHAVDVLEAVATRTPLLSRLGCHLIMLARREPGPVPARPAGIWPGPFSVD
jgi:SAM-dependent methyltransferase